MGWDDFVSKLFHFSTAQEDILATPHIPRVWGLCWNNHYASSISWIAIFMFTFIFTFTQDEQRSKCGGVYWRTLTHVIWPPIQPKMTALHATSEQNVILSNKFHEFWCSHLFCRIFIFSQYKTISNDELKCTTTKSLSRWSKRIYYLL